jgi:hypothetical protein
MRHCGRERDNRPHGQGKRGDKETGWTGKKDKGQSGDRKIETHAKKKKKTADILQTRKRNNR